MKKDFYIEVGNLEMAIAILDEIERRTGEKWAHPNKNPFGVRVIFPWNLEHLSSCYDLVHGLPRLSLDEAMKKGYGIGFHQGKFAHASQKLEEGRFLLPAVAQARANINFSATRALFYGLQSSVYSTRESLKKSCRRIGPAARDWWMQQEAKIKRSEPLIQHLHVDYNRDKHGEASGLLKPVLMLHSYSGPPPDVISGDGLFSIIERGTPRERRVFHPGAKAEMEVAILYDKQIIGGKDVSMLPLEEKLEKIIDYFEAILWEAKSTFPDS